MLQRSVDLKLAPTITHALFGASNGQCAINDQIWNECKNLGYSTMRFSLQEDFIKKILITNPHINTVLLSYNPYIYYKFTDEQFHNYTSPLFAKHSAHIAYTSYYDIVAKYTAKQILLYFSGNWIIANPSFDVMRGYDRLRCHNLHHGQWSIENYDANFPTQIDVSYEEAKKTCNIELQSIRDIITFCHDHNINVVILWTPMYHLDRWISSSGFDDFLSTLDKRIRIADYSDFTMPDDDYYADVQHLNDKGSDYFSTYIKTHGLKTESLEEYLKRKGKTLSNAE